MGAQKKGRRGSVGGWEEHFPGRPSVHISSQGRGASSETTAWQMGISSAGARELRQEIHIWKLLVAVGEVSGRFLWCWMERSWIHTLGKTGSERSCANVCVKFGNVYIHRALLLSCNSHVITLQNIWVCGFNIQGVCFWSFISTKNKINLASNMQALLDQLRMRLVGAP